MRDQDRTGPDWYTLALQAPRITAAAHPGQFVQVRVPTGSGTAVIADPLLRRPLSFCTLEAETGRLSLIYRVVGRGTALLATARAGDRLDLLGPLGRSFPDPAAGRGLPLVLVGGGLGIPPLAAAARWANTAGRQPTAIIGARTAGDLAGLAEVRQAGAEVVIATEDGTAGVRDRVTGPLAEALDATGGPAEVWACGPGGMLAAVAAVARRHGAACWLCVERPMACGFGVCAGCAIARSDGQGYLKACVDGPVFPAEAVEASG